MERKREGERKIDRSALKRVVDLMNGCTEQKKIK